jgi:hypothetical protein
MNFGSIIELLFYYGSKELCLDVVPIPIIVPIRHLPYQDKSISNIDIPSYTFFHNDSPTMAGGAALYVSNSLSPNIVSRGDWLGDPANFKRPAYCFDFDVERTGHVILTVHKFPRWRMLSMTCFCLAMILRRF